MINRSLYVWDTWQVWWDLDSALYSVKQFKVPMLELYKTNVCLFSKDLIAALINIIQYAGLPTLEVAGLPDEPRFQ